VVNGHHRVEQAGQQRGDLVIGVAAAVSYRVSLNRQAVRLRQIRAILIARY